MKHTARKAEKMKKIYVCSPSRGDIAGNIEKASKYCRMVAAMGHLPIAPHVYCTRFLDDTVERERRIGLDMGLELLAGCDELWTFTEAQPSAGMAAEIMRARQLGIMVQDGREKVAMWALAAALEEGA